MGRKNRKWLWISLILFPILVVVGFLHLFIGKLPQVPEKMDLSAVPCDQLNGLIFREIDDFLMDDQSSCFFSDEVPGYDHVALVHHGFVIETHPGYGQGIYSSRDRVEWHFIENRSGIQSQHTLETFIAYQQDGQQSPVIDWDFFPLSECHTKKMAKLILTMKDKRFSFINYTMSDFQQLLSPAGQKGSAGSFTCSGLIEWAAENSGMFNGEGFVPDRLECISIPNFINSKSSFILPLLSPQLIYLHVKKSFNKEKRTKLIIGRRG